MASVSLGKSRSDIFYRSLVISKFFTKGWGELDAVKRLFDFRLEFKEREKCASLVPSSYPVHLDKSWKRDSYYMAEGHFLSPVAKYLPGILPQQSEYARFQVIIPTKWQHRDRKPMCVHLAGTGDHFYWRRRNFMAKPLLKEHGIGSIILENPFYGSRKPKDQQRSSLKHVVDLFIMGTGLILESSVLLHWCERHGYGPLALTGISMGGHMASLAATVWPKPLAVVPCLSWSTASCVFTEGVMRKSLPWDFLKQQLEDDNYRETLIDAAGIRDEVTRECLFTNKGSMSGVKSIPVQDLTSQLNVDNHQLDMCHIRESDFDPQYTPHTVSLERRPLLSNVRDVVVNYIPPPLKKKKEQPNTICSDALRFMNILMDHATHLKNFSCPYEPKLAKFVAATSDAYVPHYSVEDTPQQIWPGSEVAYVDGGHIGASLNHMHIFRKVIKEKLDQV
ncbi:protein ABHD18 [Nematostella vectensis]|uniref:protein ABHD18 n=1 Tax=Nematostella vectensis TaxID=45351 RepID=UPI002077154E|nr:protein ABHD18 [Nematostella vectensis]